MSSRIVEQEVRKLSVVHISSDRSVLPEFRYRDDIPEYQVLVGSLNSRVKAVAEQAGWEPRFIAAAELDIADVLRQSDKADAIIIMGGEDVTPEFYGGETGYQDEGTHLPRADEAQLSVVQRAAERGTPLLGICRGHQIINVAHGGTLIPHLESSAYHRRYTGSIAQIMADHEVSLNSGSALNNLFQRDSIAIRSAHHQAVATLGAGLEVAASAEDGVIEAIAHTDAPIIGVQWHPEDLGSIPADLAVLLGFLARSGAGQKQPVA